VPDLLSPQPVIFADDLGQSEVSKSRSSKSWIGITAALVTICAGMVGASAAPSVHELFGAYEKYLGLYQRASYKVKVSVSYSGFALPKGPTAIEQYSYNVFRDGKNAKVFEEVSINTPIAGRMQASQYTNESVLSDAGAIWVAIDPAKKGPSSIEAKLDPLTDSEWLKTAGYTFAAVTDGYFPGNGQNLLLQILKGSSSSTRRFLHQDKTIWVLEGQSEWGQHSIWFDSELAPYRIMQVKKLDDWIEPDLPISRTREFDGRLFPKAHLRAITRSLEVIGLERVGDKIVPTTFVLKEEHDFDNRERVSFRSDITFSEIKLQPDLSHKLAPFAVSTRIPDGTPVTVQNRGGIAYEWRDGQIVKSLNQPSVRRLEGNWFQRNSVWARVLLLGTILVAALVTIWYLRRRQAAIS